MTGVRAAPTRTLGPYQLMCRSLSSNVVAGAGRSRLDGNTSQRMTHPCLIQIQDPGC